MKVLVTDYAWASLDIEREVLGAIGAEALIAESGDEPELTALASGCDAIMTCWKRVTPSVLDAADGCQVVARYGVGLDNIAVDHATGLGMVVTNVPDFCIDEVSDHALALMLALARRVAAFDRQTRGGDWEVMALGPIHRLRGQTIGLVGCGQIGQATAAKAQAFGMHAIALTRTLRELPHGIERAPSLESLLERADVVSLHVPLTGDTKNLIGEAELDRMKRSALLINTSRGATVDQMALTSALRKGSIAGAGLDVLATEPPNADEPLLGIDNVIVTPHCSFYSVESTEDLRRRAAECVVGVLRGVKPSTIVNPEVLDSPRLRAVALAGQEAGG